jgi:hypothetical protein
LEELGTRQTLVAKGRQDTCATVVVEVYRGRVWIVLTDPPFSSEAIFEPDQADRLIDLLGQATKEARGDTKGREDTKDAAP